MLQDKHCVDRAEWTNPLGLHCMDGAVRRSLSKGSAAKTALQGRRTRPSHAAGENNTNCIAAVICVEYGTTPKTFLLCVRV